MTATTAASRRTAAARRRARPGRGALALVIPAGPLALAVLRGTLPYRALGTPAVTAATIAAHQGTEPLVLWLTFAALLTLIPGVTAVGMIARPGAPRPGTAGLVLPVAAVLGLSWASTPAGTAGLAAARPA